MLHTGKVPYASNSVLRDSPRALIRSRCFLVLHLHSNRNRLCIRESNEIIPLSRHWIRFLHVKVPGKETFPLLHTNVLPVTHMVACARFYEWIHALLAFV